MLYINFILYLFGCLNYLVQRKFSLGFFAKTEFLKKILLLEQYFGQNYEAGFRFLFKFEKSMNSYGPSSFLNVIVLDEKRDRTSRIKTSRHPKVGRKIQVTKLF